jgi:enolase
MTNNDYQIKSIHAREILDSRGNPTVEVELLSENNIRASACVPSGASTGSNEALELRDKDPNRFYGKGVLTAVKNVKEIISPKLKGMDPRELSKIDQKMIELDGTPNKSKLGANAMLGVSLAGLKVAAKLNDIPVYEQVHRFAYDKNPEKFLIPVPMANVINGGKHAGGNLAPQEFMLIPSGLDDFSEAIRALAEIYHELKNLLKKNYGPSAVNVGDEGGFGSPVDTSNEALSLLEQATEGAGYTIKKEINFALDPAATEFYKNGHYHIDGEKITEEELVDYWVDLTKSFPIVSIEDPFHEESFEGFAALKTKIGKSVQIVGDDLTVTNVDRLEKAIKKDSINSLLLKVNQIGTLTEAFKAAKVCWENDYSVVVSHRSGETEDAVLADIVVGLCTGQIKTGSVARGERTAKYNQLLRISDRLDKNAVYPGKAFQTAFRKFV